jgi:uncharacterized protein (DUF1684 family)
MNKVLLVLFLLPSLAGYSQTDSSPESELQLFRRMYFTSYTEGDRQVYPPADTVYLDFYDYAPGFEVEADYEPLASGGRDTTIWTYSGLERAYVVTGKLVFNLGGQSLELLALQSRQHLKHPVYRYQLFVPFKDQTTGEQTYGGGRYLEVKMDDASSPQRVKLDFNRAYNPLCAYSDKFNCPIPPQENFLEMAVEAGEKAYKKEK